MQRRQRIFFFFLIATPLCIALPIALLVIYPGAVATISTAVSCLFLLATLILFFIPLSQKPLKTPSANKQLPLIKWLITIAAIELIAIALFAGQTYTISEYQAHYHKLTPTLQNKLFWQQLSHYFTNWCLFPWALIAMATVCFNRVSNRYQTSHPLSKTLPFKRSPFYPLLRRMFDIYIFSSTAIFIGLALTFACIQISLVIFPDYNPALNVLYGMVTATFILIISSTNLFKRIFSHMEARKLAPTVNFIFQTIVLVILFVAVSLVMAKLNLRTEKISRLWPPLELFAPVHSKAIAQLWFFSWWVLATPLISSLIGKLSHNKNARLTLLTIVIFPSLAVLILHLIPLKTLLTNQPILIYCAELIAFFSLLLLFAKKKDNQLLWFGFYPTVDAKKSRVINMKVAWSIAAALFGVFAITGSQSLVIANVTACIGIVIILLIALFRAI